ncbi:ThiF family adenylyltransferase [Herminiimonas fonticola]|uniref:E2/UBC family protein B n=1 Tax=Herminiimonas fonticola TaxID=303380 RepID=A0A4R6FZ67_9BURK|nr:ThiF family adenylyltransferase [Herminiimonas fonticola]RBA24359.1 ThiF family [Herminiimonas fonticola]TDN87303.1 E2/UBC family protein B [Herminiimonas fonticola]
MNPESVDSIANVVAVLKNRGFNFERRSNDGWIVLKGLLTAAGEVHPVLFSFDPKFIEIPRVRLLKVPSSLLPIAPHIDGNGGLCYIANGTVTLDICDPVGQTLACLERAENILEKIINNELIEDLEEEFFAYWNFGTFCISDVAPQPTLVLAFSIDISGSTWTILSDNIDRTSRLLMLAGHKSKPKPIPVYHLKTSTKARPRTDSWPPNDVKSILAWQGKLDSNCRKKIESSLLTAAKLAPTLVLFVINSPLMKYAFSVDFSSFKKNQRKSKFIDARSIYPLPITPHAVIRVDSEYITTRNIPNRVSLADKRIAIVGCGTIGGFLAEQLAKMGAGTGKGHLMLIDDDIMMPQNMGRHRLGIPSLFMNKADALFIEIGMQSPGVHIVSLPKKAQQVDLTGMDLVIDATGEESLGHWLANKLSPNIPLLTVWIDGPGVAVRGLIKSKADDACFRCLKEYERQKQLTSIVEELPKVTAGAGCEGLYVPFPAYVSSHAANLGAEMVLDWVNGITMKNLRTRITDSKYTLATSDCSPTTHPGCPLCRT